MPPDAGSLLRDFGYMGVGAAAFFYLAKALYELSRRNGSRPATLKDVVDAIHTHADEESEHHAAHLAKLNELSQINTGMSAAIWRLVGRGEQGGGPHL